MHLIFCDLFPRWVVTWGKCHPLAGPGTQLVQFDGRWPNTKLGETFPLHREIYIANNRKRKGGLDGMKSMDMAAENKIGEEGQKRIQKDLLPLQFVPFPKNNKLLWVMTGQENSIGSNTKMRLVTIGSLVAVNWFWTSLIDNWMISSCSKFVLEAFKYIHMELHVFVTEV